MISQERAKEILDRMRDQRILVVGDLMLDRYVMGSVSRISPEAPVPVVHVSHEHSQPGGSANVALNVQSLGGHAVVTGIVGDDHRADELVGLLARDGISTDGVVVCEGVTTTVKTRVMADRQQVVRVDKEDGPGAVTAYIDTLCSRIESLAAEVSAIIIEDYGKGVITQRVVDTVLREAKKHGIPVALDPKDNHELNFAGLALATPNYKESLIAAGLPESLSGFGPEDNDALAQAGRHLMEKWTPDFLIITLGPHGMYLLGREEPPTILPTKAREVFDVSGAGDTVIATALLALVAGASRYEAASLANHAAGVVVARIGTVPCPRDALLTSVMEE